jgi:hypothetical protein
VRNGATVTLTSALRWLRRRVAPIHRILATAIGLLPARFEGCAPTVTSFRERLGTMHVLVALLEICVSPCTNPAGVMGEKVAGRVASSSSAVA